MAEKLGTKIRCIGIDFADPITNKEGVASANFVEQMLTLRDDELVITPGDVTETRVQSHENDIDEDYDAIGSGRTASGSFIKASMEQLKELLGGEVVGTGDNAMYLKSGKLPILNKAIRFRLKGGGAIIIPNARGYVDIDANLGATNGMLKCPFKFSSLAQPGFDCDLIIQAKIPTTQTTKTAVQTEKAPK
jgi:hypothetical protein